MNNLVHLNDYRWNVDWIISDLVDEFFETGTDEITKWLIQNKEEVGLSEKEIKDAMALYIENEHQLLEGAAGTAVAALIKAKDKLKGKKVGVVICGGNIAVDTLRKVIS